MSRRSSRREGQPPNEDEIINIGTDNNIISHGRNESSSVPESEINRRRQLEHLKFANGLQPSCTDYGQQREEQYPGFFFCSGCKEWDNRPRENKRAKKTQKRYKCTAGHTSFLHPTVHKKEWMPSKKSNFCGVGQSTSNCEIGNNNDMIDIDFSLNNEFGITVQPAEELPCEYVENYDVRDTIDSLKAEIEIATNKLNKMQDEKNALNKIIHRLRCKIESLKKQKPATLCEGIVTAIDGMVSNFFRRLSPKKIGREIADACWNYCDGVAKFATMQKARKYLRQHVFTPHAILEKMDLAGRICNLKAYMVLLGAERDAKDPLRDYSKDATILPHEWRIRHASKLANT